MAALSLLVACTFCHELKNGSSMIENINSIKYGYIRDNPYCTWQVRTPNRVLELRDENEYRRTRY
jgi:hypothetical protein